jgi:hypothetical protein
MSLYYFGIEKGRIGVHEHDMVGPCFGEEPLPEGDVVAVASNDEAGVPRSLPSYDGEARQRTEPNAPIEPRAV